MHYLHSYFDLVLFLVFQSKAEVSSRLGHSTQNPSRFRLLEERNQVLRREVAALRQERQQYRKLVNYRSRLTLSPNQLDVWCLLSACLFIDMDGNVVEWLLCTAVRGRVGIVGTVRSCALVHREASPRWSWMARRVNSRPWQPTHWSARWMAERGSDSLMAATDVKSWPSHIRFSISIIRVYLCDTHSVPETLSYDHSYLFAFVILKYAFYDWEGIYCLVHDK